MLRRLWWTVGVSLWLAGMMWAQGGQFLEPPTITTGSFPSSVAIGDFNNDGKMDVVEVNRFEVPPTITVFLSNGDGTFAGQTPYNILFQASSIAVGDFDGDQNLDVVVTYPGTDQIGVVFGDGAGGFSSGPHQYNTGATPEWVAVASLRNNGFLDVVT